jgi:SAM-dependent methyltransferase
MSFSVIKNFYDQPAIRPTETTSLMLRGVMPLFDPGSGGRFLDIACYDGWKTAALQRLLAATLTIGVDFEGAALSEAKQQGIPCVAIDLNQDSPLPFPDSSFDCIHAGEVIEHLFSPDLLLEEIARLLKPNGYAVISTPNLASWRNRIALLLGWQPFDAEVSTRYIVGNPRDPRTMISGHIRIFTARALRELAGLHGLSIRRLVGFPNNRPVSLFTRLLGAVDILARIFFPTLCDSLMIKVEKKNPSIAVFPDHR